jgi:hypothetical protein
VDPDRHIEFHNEGWEACSRAMEATVRSDEALPLFDKAIDRFKVQARGCILQCHCSNTAVLLC